MYLVKSVTYTLLEMDINILWTGLWGPYFCYYCTHTHTHTHNMDKLVLVLLCVFQIRWLLEDEIVSALRHSRVISSATLQKVAEHVLRSSGRPHCHCEDVPLQFVFGPEQSLEKFKEARTHTCTHRNTTPGMLWRWSTVLFYWSYKGFFKYLKIYKSMTPCLVSRNQYWQQCVCCD